MGKEKHSVEGKEALEAKGKCKKKVDECKKYHETNVVRMGKTEA